MGQLYTIFKRNNNLLENINTMNDDRLSKMIMYCKSSEYTPGRIPEDKEPEAVNQIYRPVLYFFEKLDSWVPWMKA